MSGYTISQFKIDLFNTMKSRPTAGVYSGRALGNSANISLWTDDKIKSFFNGVLTAHYIFFNRMQLIDFARMIICECCQESTGDYRLGVKPINFKDYTSHGIIQVTPASVLLDYYNYGKPILDINKKLILSPSMVQTLDLADPGVCIVIWAWYVRNGISMGVSMNEWINREIWYIPVGGVTRDYGNCLYTWLGGNSNNRHIKTDPGFDDYHNRLLDYYIASGYGDKERYEQLLSTLFDDTIIGVYETADNKINNRDTCVIPTQRNCV